jgi:hypothetical protein
MDNNTHYITIMLVCNYSEGYIQSMKTKLIQIRVEPDKATLFHERAKQLGMSVSEYVRYLVKLDTEKPVDVESFMIQAKAIGKSLNRLNLSDAWFAKAVNDALGKGEKLNK